MVIPGNYHENCWWYLDTNNDLVVYVVWYGTDLCTVGPLSTTSSSFAFALLFARQETQFSLCYMLPGTVLVLHVL
jgi:hypothetical protein